MTLRIVGLVVGFVLPSASLAATLPDLGPRFTEACAHFEKEVGPLDPAAYAPPAIPPEKNAAIPLADSLTLLNFTDADSRLVARLIPPDSDWTEKERADLGALLARNERALAKARIAADKPHSRFELDYGHPIFALLPGLHRVPHLADLIALGGRLDQANHDVKRATESVESLAGIARAFGTDPIMTHLMMAWAVEHRQFLLIRYIVGSDGGSATELQDLDGTIGRYDVRKSLENAVVLDALGMVKQAAADMEAEKDADEVAEVVAILSAYLDQVRAAVIGIRHGISPSRSVQPPSPADLGGVPRRHEDRDTLSQLLSWHLNDEMWHRAVVLQDGRRLAHAALAVRIEGLTAGRYPEFLDSLVKDHEGLTYKVNFDGSVTISAPVAQELIDSVAGSQHVLHNSGLRWVLPPVAPPKVTE